METRRSARARTSSGRVSTNVTPTKKVSTKVTPAKKVASNVTPTKKVSTKVTPAKKVASNSAPTKKVSTKLTPAKKVSTKLTPAKKLASKVASAKKVSPKRPRASTKKVATPKPKKSTPPEKNEACKTKQKESQPKLSKDEAIKAALSQLHSSSVPECLPCREKQYADIFQFVEQKLLENEGGCMYISGVPGTGKTATLYAVKRTLSQNKDLPSFKFVEINGLRIGHPNQFYVHLLMELSGKKSTNLQAVETLNERFTNGKANKEFVVLFVDELDFLRTKKQDILYHLFDWPNHNNSKLIVLAIANAMDLPERFLMNRVASRLGLTRLSFQPYNFRELEQIVRSRLVVLERLEVFEWDALQLICRKVASVSGDARRVLDICRRALEMTIGEQRAQVTMDDVDRALKEIFNSIKIFRIRMATRHEQILLQCIAQDFRSSGIEECCFHDIYQSHVARCRLEDLPTLTTSELTKVATNLDLSKLILFEKSPSHLYRRLRLNVSLDDIHFAFNLDLTSV